MTDVTNGSSKQIKAGMRSSAHAIYRFCRIRTRSNLGPPQRQTCMTYNTMALTQIHQKMVQACENNWVRRIVGVKRADNRRMEELGMEIGFKESFKKKLVKSRLKWVGRVERTGDGKLAESRCPDS